MNGKIIFLFKKISSRHGGLVLLLLTLMSATTCAQQLYVGTLNVQNQNDDDARNGNGWAKRCQVICDMMNFEQPDILAAQEMKSSQLRGLLNGMDGYDYVGVGRDDGKSAGEFVPIFFNTLTLSVIDSGTFWLSETPDVPSKGWDAANICICTWAHLLVKATNKEVVVYNMHLDHKGTEARRKSVEMVLARAGEAIEAGTSVILMGSFNADQDNEATKVVASSGMLTDAYVKAAQRYAENGTSNSFSYSSFSDRRYDHVFVSRDATVENYAILPYAYWTENLVDKKEGSAKYTRRQPSDHYPVMVKMVM